MRVYSICLWKYVISNPTLVRIKSKFFVLCTIMNDFLCNYSWWVEPMKGMVKMQGCKFYLFNSSDCYNKHKWNNTGGWTDGCVNSQLKTQ